MKRARIVLLLALGAFLGCESTETDEAQPVRELTSDKLDRLDKLLGEWTVASRGDAPEEVYRCERKIRRLVDNHFLPVRLGLRSDEERRRAICAACIGFTMDVGVVRDLLHLLRDGSAVVRNNALLSLTKIGYKRIPLDLLLPALEDEDPHVRRSAVVCLETVASVLTEGRIVEELSLMLTDPDFGVRMNVAHALGSLGNSAGVAPLLRRGLADEDDRVRYNTAIALGELKSFDAVGPLIKAGETEVNDAVTREISRALSAITGQDHGLDFEAWSKWHADFLAKRRRRSGSMEKADSGAGEGGEKE